MTIMNMSKPTPVPTQQVAKIVETGGGSCRFKRLKMYARTITKGGKERRNATASGSENDTGLGQETIKGGSRKLGGEPEFLLVLPPKEPNNFDTLVRRNFEASQYSPNHLSPPLPPQKPTESTDAKDGRAVSVSEAQQQSSINHERRESLRPDRLSAGSQSSLLLLSNAFRDTVFSESDGIPAWTLPQKSTDSHKSIGLLSDMSVSPPMSPNFLNPRQAPYPPPVEPEDPDLTFTSATSAVTGETGNSCAATISSSDSAQSSKYDTVEGQLPRFLASPSPSDLPKTLPSAESGLARIGAALLGYGSLSHNECLLTSSCSSLDAHDTDGQSLGSLLDTMERHGSFVRELSQSHTSESVSTFVLPSMNSAPANLADSSFSLNDMLSSNSWNLSKNMRVKSLLRASFTESLSNLEQLLQDQGVTVPSSRNLVELLQALSMGTGRDGFTGTQAVETIQWKIRRDPQGSTGSLPAAGSHPLAPPNHTLLERVEVLLKSRPRDLTPSASHLIQGAAMSVQTELIMGNQDSLLFEEGDSRGLNGVGIAI